MRGWPPLMHDGRSGRILRRQRIQLLLQADHPAPEHLFRLRQIGRTRSNSTSRSDNGPKFPRQLPSPA